MKSIQIPFLPMNLSLVLKKKKIQTCSNTLFFRTKKRREKERKPQERRKESNLFQKLVHDAEVEGYGEPIVNLPHHRVIQKPPPFSIVAELHTKAKEKEGDQRKAYRKSVLGCARSGRGGGGKGDVSDTSKAEKVGRDEMATTTGGSPHLIR